MQPVFPYRAQSYPPRGSMWPTFGDDVLEDTLSVSEGAHRALSEKRQSMNDFHKENLVYAQKPRLHQMSLGLRLLIRGLQGLGRHLPSDDLISDLGPGDLKNFTLEATGPSLRSIQITPWSLRQGCSRTWATLRISQEQEQ